MPAAIERASSAVQVVLAIEPLDARVFRGTTDLGQSPVIVSVSPNEGLTLLIKREGYASQTVTLDGTESKRSIKLRRAKKKAPAPGAAAPKSQPSPARSNIGGSEIINPWESR